MDVGRRVGQDRWPAVAPKSAGRDEHDHGDGSHDYRRDESYGDLVPVHGQLDTGQRFFARISGSFVLAVNRLVIECRPWKRR